MFLRWLAPGGTRHALRPTCLDRNTPSRFPNEHAANPALVAVLPARPQGLRQRHSCRLTEALARCRPAERTVLAGRLPGIPPAPCPVDAHHRRLPQGLRAL